MQILFQILFIVFSAFAVKSIWSRKKDGLPTTRGAWFWTLFWIAASIAVAWPQSTNIFANIFGIGRGSDIVIYVSVATIFFILFRLHIKLEKINRTITKWVREDALITEEKNNNV